MAMGRPRKSMLMHQIEGTYKPASHDGQGGPDETGRPVPTKKLTGKAKWLWNHYAGKPWLVEADSVQLTQLCEVYGFYCKAVTDYESDRTDKELRVSVQSWLDAFNKLAARFGMNPSDRARLPKMPSKPDGESAEAKYFGTVG